MSKEKQNDVELIEYELATFIRKAVYLEQSEKKIGQLRSKGWQSKRIFNYRPGKRKTGSRYRKPKGPLFQSSK
ncbi:Uncharacterised protein [Mycobacteroides abscessus subsp. abscessus]|nr:Uncharacterised protein [Mycobacteroides abscessus subsp. abscessus]